MNTPYPTRSITREEADHIAVSNGIIDKFYLIGFRGYEAEKENERGIYDDAIFLVTPDEIFGVLANTDPSVERKGIAVMQPGTYQYKKGLHGMHHLNMNDAADMQIYKTLMQSGEDLPSIPSRILPYWAFRQASPVTVLRDGQNLPETKVHPTEWPWIDIHRGGFNTTSSEGCQTIHPDHWGEFRNKGFEAFKKYSQALVSYTLIA